MEKKKCRIDYLLGGLLFLLPFLHVCIGVNTTDQGYNLANFELFPHMNQTWMISTLIANIVGKLLTWLPFGHFMLGMNVYCTLLLSILSVVFFVVLKKDFSKYAVFCGLVIAISFSWAPKVTLYQYLSYYLFNAAALMLLWGLRKENRRLLFGAGVVLGINLFVRFPNILHTALIVVVVYAAILRKKHFQELMKDILMCIAGYFAVAIPGIVLIEIIWGRGAYPGMINSLFAMTDTATSYSPFSMFTSVYYAYAENWYWFKWFLLEALAGVLVYGFLRKKWMKYAMQLFLVCGFVVILRFYWYWGMFNVKYTAYESVYVWGANLLMLAGLIMAFAVVLPKVTFELKLYGLAMLVIIGITPLGSNNVLYSNFNNLYLLAPVLAGMTELLWQRCQNQDRKEVGRKVWNFSAIPLVLVSTMLIGITAMQTFLFHGCFVFGDTKITAETSAKVEGNKKLTGMITTRDNAESLSQLSRFIEENDLTGSETIVWSQAPILYYILDTPCAIGHFWPSLDSYPYEEFVRDIEEMEEYPMIIYQSIYYEDLIKGAPEGDRKSQVIAEILQKGNYEEVFRNGYYTVCLPGGKASDLN